MPEIAVTVSALILVALSAVAAAVGSAAAWVDDKALICVVLSTLVSKADNPAMAPVLKAEIAVALRTDTLDCSATNCVEDRELICVALSAEMAVKPR